MTTNNRNDVRHDRDQTRHLTPVVPGIALVSEWRTGLSSWFRSLRPATLRPGLRETAFWFFGSRRLQPILVVSDARQYAATRLGSRGHFTRI